jgi:hypothetical protein
VGHIRETEQQSGNGSGQCHQDVRAEGKPECYREGLEGVVQLNRGQPQKHQGARHQTQADQQQPDPVPAAGDPVEAAMGAVVYGEPRRGERP